MADSASRFEMSELVITHAAPFATAECAPLDEAVWQRAAYEAGSKRTISLKRSHSVAAQISV